MSTREKILIGIALLFAALFVRLGFWQLERLRERQAYNAPIEARAGLAPVALRDLPRDPGEAIHRSVRVSGEYDYDREIVLTLRSRQGSPGVNLLTPLRVAGSDTAILVNRGWIYAADGVAADTKPWREDDPVDAVGYVRLLETGDTTGARSTGRPDAVRRPSLSTIRAMLPYPVAPVYVVLTSPGSDPTRAPPRVPPPALDEGNHRSYAVQWFTFALIALGGTAILVLRRRAGD
ncbi:MAG: SURF1 family protein [Gemmatimonadaceae bacterium]|nr:SURF1 family protein [Gemmatimonadaceae bacterium]